MTMTRLRLGEIEVVPILFDPPKPDGYWEVGGPEGLVFAVMKKPRWLHRKMARLLLGWHWGDGPIPRNPVLYRARQ